MSSAMALVVAAYVETRQLAALQDLKTHREMLIASVQDRVDFNFGLLLGQLDDDLREIEAGIRRLRMITDVPPAAG